MDNETKIGRGGARANSGAKSSGIETVTIRIDKRLLNAVTAIKAKFKDGTLTLDDIISQGKPKQADAKLTLDDIASQYIPKQDDTKLLKKIAKLEREKKESAHYFLARMSSDGDQISALKSALALSKGGLDDKFRKKLIQFCHPDKHQDEKTKAIANELMQELNRLKS